MLEKLIEEQENDIIASSDYECDISTDNSELSDESFVSRTRMSKLVTSGQKKRKPVNLILKVLQSHFKCKGGIPPIPFCNFIERFTELGGLTTPIITTGYIYLTKAVKKLDLRDPECLHKLFSCCLFMAHKFCVDTEYWHIEDWAKLAGVKEDELLK
jgi:hypothetical protein